MRTAESWVGVICPAAHIGTAGELERQIMRVQSDAMLEAAEIAYQVTEPTDIINAGRVRRAIEEKAYKLIK